MVISVVPALLMRDHRPGAAPADDRTRDADETPRAVTAF
jgi:hypothetical protein